MTQPIPQAQPLDQLQIQTLQVRQNILRNELDIQAENRALQTADRSRIIRNALIFLGIHSFVFIMLQLLMG